MSANKFKFWDEKGSFFIDLNDFDNQVFVDCHGRVVWASHSGIEVIDWIKPIRFTGLTDKNGVEIYEGDVVKIHECRICEVIFHKEAGCWDLLVKNVLSSLSIPPVSPSSYKYHAEVIGNIYENPELLEAAS